MMVMVWMLVGVFMGLIVWLGVLGFFWINDVWLVRFLYSLLFVCVFFGVVLEELRRFLVDKVFFVFLLY